MPIFQNITNADLKAWRDPGATIQDAGPTDPADHACIYHDKPMTVPITAEITSRWDMIRWACRPCAEQIVAYLHGADLDQVDRKVVIAAAKLSAGMARTIGMPSITATVTELRPHDDPPDPQTG
jgi:hypothetical protein